MNEAIRIKKLKCVSEEEYIILRNKLAVHLKKLNKKQIGGYAPLMNKFLEHLDRHGYSLKNITKDIITEYVSKSKRLKGNFKAIYNFLIKENYLSKDDNNKYNTFTSACFKDYIEEYLTSRKREGLRPASICLYRRYLWYFNNYLKQKGIETLNSITKDIIEDYIFSSMNTKSKLTRKAISINTVRDNVFVLKGYFSYLIRKDYILYNPMETVKAPKKEKRISQNSLTIEELKDLFTKIELQSEYDIRHYVLFALSYNSGLRINEALSIKKEDINFETGMLCVKEGKGGYERTVPMTSYLQRLLKIYITTVYRRYFENEEGYLFVSAKMKKLLPGYARKILYAYIKKINIGKKITFHAFRKSIGKHMLENGLGIRYVQKFLGHRSINSTAAYTRLTITDLKNAVSKYHPREINKKEYIDKSKYTGIKNV